MKKLLAFFAVLIPIIVVLIVLLTSKIVGVTVDITVDDINLNMSSMSLTDVETTKIEYEIVPSSATNKSVIFTSSDESIATVDQSGNVTFIGNGTVFITATTVDGNKTKTCEIKIGSTKASGVNLYLDKNELSIGETAKLDAKVFPATVEDKRVDFESLNSDIASVDQNGIITALAVGIAEIKVRSRINNEIANTISVEVTKKPTDFELSKANIITYSGVLDLEANFTPVDTSEKYKQLTYESSNTSVATVNRKGSVVFSKFGQVDVTARTYYGDLESTITVYNTDGYPTDAVVGDIDSDLSYDTDNKTGTILVDYSALSYKHIAKFESSNTNVIIVDSRGNYHVKGGGVATVSATIKVAEVVDGDISLVDKTEDIIFNITRNVASIDVANRVDILGKSYQILANALPLDATDKTLSYVSQDDTIASVSSSGLVTFNMAGIVSITVTAKSGATKDIMIASAFGYPIGASFGDDLQNIKIGDSKNLIVNFDPKDATHISGTFSSADTSIIEIDENGRITGKQRGTTKIKYEYQMWNGTEITTASVERPIRVYEPVSEIVPDLALEKYAGRYITAKSVFALSVDDSNLGYEILPASADVAKFELISQSNDVYIENNIIYFDDYGVYDFALRTTDINGGVAETVILIEYVKGIIDANIVFEDDIDQVVDMYVGDQYEILLDSDTIKPIDAVDRNFKLVATDNKLSVNGNVVIAKDSGISSVFVVFKNGYQKTVNVCVKQQVEQIEFAKVNNDNVTFKTELDLVATVAPYDADNKALTYSVSDTSIAGIDQNGKLTFVSDGTVTVTAVAKDGQGASGSIEIRSTFGAIESFDISAKKNTTDQYVIYQGEKLEYEFYPIDGNLDNLAWTILSETPTLGTDVIEEVSGNIIGSNNGRGEAVIEFVIANPSGDLTHTANVLVSIMPPAKIDEVELLADSISLYAGDTFNLRDNIDFITPSTIDQRYINYLDIQYLNNADGNVFSDGITIVGDTLEAFKYGTYSVVMIVENPLGVGEDVTIEKTIVVNVFASQSDIQHQAIEETAVNNTSYLEYASENSADGETRDVIVSSKYKFGIGTPTVAVGSHMTDFSTSFVYVSSDTDVAEIDQSGSVTFKKDGIVEIEVYQYNRTNNANSVASQKMNSIFVRYFSSVQSADFVLGGKTLNRSTSNEFNYRDNLAYHFDNVYPKGASTANSEVTIVSYQSNDKMSQVIATTAYNGLVAKSGGTATIEVKLGDMTAYYIIEIIRDVEGIADLSDVYTSSKSFALPDAVIEPADATDKTYTYTSSNNLVATIVDDRIAFSRAGEVTVTVTASNGMTTTFKAKSTYGGFEDFELRDVAVTIAKGENFEIRHDLLLDGAGGFAPTYTVSANSANGGVDGNVLSVTGNIVRGLLGGTAEVTVSAVNAFGITVQHSISITVIEDVELFYFEDQTIADFAENRYITSKDSVQIDLAVLPLSASDRSATWTSSDPNIASVDSNGLVTFKERGYVTITAILNSDNTKQSSVSFFYTSNIAHSVTLVPFNTNLNFGDEINLQIASIIPSDLTIADFDISVLTSAINGGTGSVLSIDNGKISATAGGTATLNIVVNGYNVGNYDFVVASKIKSIDCASSVQYFDYTVDKHIITHQLVPTYLPLHADRKLGFVVQSGSGVTVDSNGLMTISDFGSAVVRVFSTIDPSIFKDVNVAYVEKIISGLDVNTTEVLFGGKEFVFTVTALFNGTEYEVVDNSTVTFKNNTPNLISITNGAAFAKNNVYGTAEVEISYRGKSKKVQFVVVPVVDSMGFDLTNAGDNLGIKGEKVFGTHYFVDPASPSLSALKNTRQMQFSSLTNIPTSTPLIWTSSNASVATVNSNGLVTFVNPNGGDVTITCKPVYQYAGELATYTFKVVKGINAHNITEFEVFTSWRAAHIVPAGNSLKNDWPAVLHSDIIYTSDYKANFFYNPARTFRGLPSLYGNGHTLDASNGTQSTYDSPNTFQITTSDTFIDNVTLVGCKNKGDLTDFEEEPVTLSIRGYANKYAISNIVVSNSTIMNGVENVESYSATYTLSGCHMKNAYMGNLVLNAFAAMLDYPSKATVKNCVFENSLTPSIYLKVDKPDIKYHNELYIEGNIYINNWRTKNQIPKALDATFRKQLEKMFNEMEDSNHRFYNSGGYVNLGTLIASAESVTNKLVNDGKIYENLDYFDSMTSSEQFKFNVYLIYTARVRLGSYPKTNVPTLPGLSGPLLPGTVLNSSIYQFIRDTSV